MSNVSKPISVSRTFSVLCPSALSSGAPMAATGSAATSHQDFIGVLLYDTGASEHGDVALSGSSVYALVNSTGALTAGTALKVGAGYFVSVAVGTDIANAVLLEGHPGGGTKLLKVFVK